MTVKDVMTKPFVIKKDMTLIEAARIMIDKNTGCLLFLKDEEIRGILTERDLLKNFQKDRKVSEVMSKKIISVTSNSEVSEAIKLMRKNDLKRIPVVDNGRLVGLITSTDLIANAEELDEDFFF